jgi:hypothetical protein
MLTVKLQVKRQRTLHPPFPHSMSSPVVSKPSNSWTRVAEKTSLNNQRQRGTCSAKRQRWPWTTTLWRWTVSKFARMIPYDEDETPRYFTGSISNCDTAKELYWCVQLDRAFLSMLISAMYDASCVPAYILTAYIYFSNHAYTNAYHLLYIKDRLSLRS